MAAEVQTGKGTVAGITNSGSAITISGYATFNLKSAKLGHKFDIQDIKDANNFDNTAIATNEHTELDIEFVVSGADRAAAAATAVFLAPLAAVTLANFKIAAFNGVYQYRGDASIDLTDSGPAKMMLKIRKYADSTQNTALTTTISG